MTKTTIDDDDDACMSTRRIKSERDEVVKVPNACPSPHRLALAHHTRGRRWRSCEGACHSESRPRRPASILTEEGAEPRTGSSTKVGASDGNEPVVASSCEFSAGFDAARCRLAHCSRHSRSTASMSSVRALGRPRPEWACPPAHSRIRDCPRRLLEPGRSARNPGICRRRAGPRPGPSAGVRTGS